MSTPQTLISATELAARETTRFPNESAEYRKARIALLAEEIELRRHIERVAEMRRSLPRGGEVPEDYRFIGEQGETRLSELFEDKNTLVTYSYMFGPQRERPCPMCTSLLSSWDGEIPDIQQNVAIAVIARSPIQKLSAFKKERGWQHLPMYCDVTEAFSRDYYGKSEDGSDIPGFNVFMKRGGTIYHFWAGEMGSQSADPGQDPRGAPDLMPLWTILDSTPEGRRPTWYPRLEYR